ncbi:MAG: ion transporter [Bacteroidales bacterium]|nr:ion transporter [Bacteroidales bacterium]
MQKLKFELSRVFDDNLNTKQWHNWVDYTIIGLIIISTVEVFLSTFDSIVQRYSTWLHIVDVFTTVFFTIEVSLRIWCADLLDPKYKGFWGRIRYCLSFYGLIDILSTYTFYIAFLLPIPYSLLKALRIARLMRMFRYMKAFRLLSEAISSKKRELWVSLQFLCIVTLILSFILYFVEHEAQPEVYDNGWTSVVWAFAQYIGDPGSFADQPPITLPGKIIACIVGLLGIAIFAVPAGLVGSGFSDVMDEKRHEESAAEWAEELHNAFESKLDRPTGLQVVPPYITIPEAQARIWHKEDEILDAVSVSKDMRLINLAVTRPLGEYSDDRLAVELFPLNTPYGCCIDRGSKITIVAPSNVVDPVIGHFAYHLALIGGFNYLSREKGQQKPYRSYYLFDDEQAIEGLSEYMADLRKLTAPKDAWAITLLAASGANESEYSEQLHFEYGGKKGEDSFASDLASSENLQKLYNALSVSLEEKYDIKTSNQKYHDTSSPRNFYRKIGQPVNGLMLRIAWSVTCWDYRYIQIAATMADIIHHELDSNNMKYRPDNLKQKTIGYGID